jgi:hypothetical protein
MDLDQLGGLDEPRAPERSPEASLAVAVIALAVDDLHNPTVPLRARETAELFFESDMLAFWCARLDLNPAAVRERLRRR